LKKISKMVLEMAIPQEGTPGVPLEADKLEPIVIL
jgi:hypothetical protein